MIQHYILLIVMTWLGAFGALFLKKATASAKSLFGLLRVWQFYLGGFLYFASAVLNIYLLRYLDYSVVLPLTSITYIWTLLIASVDLKEQISRFQILGIICIVVGAVMITI